jgi:hypothetical protein
MGLALLKSEVSQCDVEVAWATYHALMLAEINDPAIKDNTAHKLALSGARVRFERFFNEWCCQ